MDIEVIDILTIIGGIAVSIIGYFLKRTMDELKEIKDISIDNKMKIKILENDYVNKIDQLNQRMDLLYKGIERLTENIEKLNNRIK